MAKRGLIPRLNSGYLPSKKEQMSDFVEPIATLCYIDDVGGLALLVVAEYFECGG